MTTFDNDAERRQFRTIYQLIAVFRDVEKDMPMSMAVIFVWVSLNEGKTQVDLRNALGMPSATSSRNLAALSKVHRLGKEGHNLIKWEENPEDRRAKLLYLTTKGKALTKTLLATL